MPACARIGDMTSGHTEGSCFFPGRPILSGSGNVFVNGIALSSVGDNVEVHCCGSSCHDATISSGSSTVFVNGKAVARIDDQISCKSEDIITSGSGDVFVN